MAILTEETGEVARIMARFAGEQSWSAQDKEKFGINEANEGEKGKQLLADELSDVIWVVSCIANYYHIDLQDALNANLDKKTKRDKQRHIENIKLQQNEQ